jgi:hypothetical protein
MAGNGFSVLSTDLKLIETFVPTMETSTAGIGPTNTLLGDAWFVHSDSPGVVGTRAIFGVDGGSEHSDSITIFRAEIESGNKLGNVVGITGDSRIRLDEPAPTESIQVGDIIVLGNGSRAVIFEVDSSFTPGSEEIPIKKLGRFTPNNLSFSFPFAGSYLFNFRDVTFVTYYIDEGKNQLMADYHDKGKTGYDDLSRQSFVVAYNVEDLQVYYFYGADTVDLSVINTNPDISSTKLNNENIKAVVIGMTSRSPYGDGTYNKVRPALFNRASGSNKDDHFRTMLTQTIYLRNYHL